MTIQSVTAADSLRGALGDLIALPGDAAYDTARLAWNRAIDQRPAAVALPNTAEDVVDVVRAVTAAGLRLAPQSTGHAAAALADTGLEDTVLVNLSGLRGVSVDAEKRRARVLGGSLWNDVLDAAAPHGLTALHGSAGDVSVAGYALSGGLSFYGRTHGLAVNSVHAVQVVTADGSLVRASAEDDTDLFWAVRGGSGAFGVVVSLEIDLVPYADVHAGMLLWDAGRAPEVSRAWASFTDSAPRSATTALRVMHFPPMPELPPFLSGRDLVVIDGAILEDDAEASALLEPLRALEPEMDTFGRIPAAALVGVHMDPPTPTPAFTAYAVLSELPAEALDAWLTAAGAPGVFVAEIRHLGGAFAESPAGAGAIGSLHGEYLAGAIAMVPVPEMAPMAHAAVHGVRAALDAWKADTMALTFIDGGVDAQPAFGESLRCLKNLKAQYDPAGVFTAAHPV